MKSADIDGAIVFGADFLDRVAAGGPDAFARDAWVAEPLALGDMMSILLVDNTLWPEDLAAPTGGAPAFCLRRVQPWESP